MLTRLAGSKFKPALQAHLCRCSEPEISPPPIAALVDNLSTMAAAEAPQITGRRQFVEYARECEEFRRQLVGQIAEVLVEMETYASNTRAQDEIEVVGEDIKNAVVGTMLDARQYLEILRDHGSDTFREEPELEHVFVLCTRAEAADMLHKTKWPPLCPFLVRDHPPRVRNLSIDTYLNYLEHKGAVQVHDFSRPRTTEDGFIQPMSMTSRTIKKRLDGLFPVNCLNLSKFVQDSLPDFFEGMPEWNILSMMPGTSRDPFAPRAIDQSETADFTLLCSKNAPTTAHVDGEAVVTTGELVQGRKAWLIWGPTDQNSLDAWTQSKKYSPSGRPVLFSMKPGDRIVMPKFRLHRVFSPQASLMVGRKLWHSRDLPDIVHWVRYQLDKPAVSNEDLPQELIEKLPNILRLVERGGKFWPTPTDPDQVRRMRKDIEV